MNMQINQPGRNAGPGGINDAIPGSFINPRGHIRNGPAVDQDI